MSRVKPEKRRWYSPKKRKEIHDVANLGKRASHVVAMQPMEHHRKPLIGERSTVGF
jgi:hypothetical protein